MAEISVEQIKKLKELSGAGLTDAKKALVEADGDMDAAVKRTMMLHVVLCQEVHHRVQGVGIGAHHIVEHQDVLSCLQTGRGFASISVQGHVVAITRLTNDDYDECGIIGCEFSIKLEKFSTLQFVVLLRFLNKRDYSTFYVRNCASEKTFVDDIVSEINGHKQPQRRPHDNFAFRPERELRNTL